MKSILIGSTYVHNVADSSVRFYTQIPVKGVADLPQRIVQFDRASEDGAYMGNVFQGQRVISLTGNAAVLNSDDYPTIRRNLSSLAVPTKDANNLLVPKVCVFTDDSGNQYQISGQVVNMQFPDQYMRIAPFSFDIRCHDWFFTSTSGKTLSLVPSSGGGVVLPVTLPAIFAPGTGNSGSCNNAGDVQAYPVITLQGPLTNPLVNNFTTGKYVSINAVLSASNTMVIDMKNKTVTKNGTSSMASVNPGSSWWALPSGISSVILTTGSSTDTGNVSIAYRDSYSGI